MKNVVLALASLLRPARRPRRRAQRPATLVLACIAVVGLLVPPARAQRQMENLGRGLVALKKDSRTVYLSWRVLGLDPPDIGFNVYRSTDGG
ncbi:MAG TPA: hypothetical protein P5233_15555, partial [Candidatus Paceibacterota bacterium]|nr:hypothetical protein [Candidatus Paceibacterota bacterium]